VNVPAQLLATQEFFERMAKTRNTLKKHHLSLIVELTEDSLMQTDSASLDALKRIRENGVGLAIDDFGKGYSSLNYIRQIPANELKIDRDFVRALLTDQKDHHIVKTAIELAEAFDMQSTAEGVDSIELLLELWKMKCCIIQGFFLARPMKLEALEAWFRNDAVAKFEQLIESERQNRRSGGLGHLVVKS
jgi:EAL domain-containing protein (putative c-di-GMP-specific phosphodiesterase class I)